MTLRPSIPENADRLKVRSMQYLGVRFSVAVDVSGITLEADEVTGDPQLEVATAGGRDFKPLVPGQLLQFGVGAALIVRASA